MDGILISQYIIFITQPGNKAVIGPMIPLAEFAHAIPAAEYYNYNTDNN
jgi:hypothetical protein